MKKVSLIVSTAVALCVSVQGCVSLTPGKKVQPGDQAEVDYLCRTISGELAAASFSHDSSRIDGSIPRSPIYLPRKNNTPMKIKIGERSPELKTQVQGGLEEELEARFSSVIQGMLPGETRLLKLEPKANKGEKVVRMARVRQRPKMLRMTPGEFRSRTGRQAEPGQSYTIDPSFPGTVVAVRENEVEIQFSAQPGAHVPTPFGDGTIRDGGEMFEIVIDARPGTLVRSGPLVGRIASVDEKFIGVDFGDPFGGKALQCEIWVNSVKQTKKDSK